MSVDRRRSSVVQVDHGDDGVLRGPDDAIRRLSVIKPDIGQEQEHAQLATDFEKNLTVRQALRLYKRAVLCSAALSLAVVMEGYVNILLEVYNSESHASQLRLVCHRWLAGFRRFP